MYRAPRILIGAVACMFGASAVMAEVVTTTANNGNVVMQDIPPVPTDIVDALNRYQNTRSAAFRDWTEDGRGVYITTRFAEVNQVHRVDMPGGARHQVTFDREPVGQVVRQPRGSAVLFTRDVGGSEFSQIFMLDPADGTVTMLSDGESRNSSVAWDRDGRRVAFQSTRRNGTSNDVWLLDPADRDGAKMVLESPDGSAWWPVEFSSSGGKVLVQNYVSIADSRVHLLDLDTETHALLAGAGLGGGSNEPIGFSAGDEGIWLVTDRGGEFRQLAWQAAEPGAEPEIVTGDIPWDIDDVAISNDRGRVAFAVNENGLSRVYLMDARTRQYRAVAGVPTGLAGELAFSPDDTRLAMTLNTPQTPSDTFVLTLGQGPLDYGALVRWTYSEVGGLDTSRFVTPELIRFPTFDAVDGAPRQIPAWVYKPPGKGPFPVVVSIHGGPEGQARPLFSSTYQMWLANLGVAVVVPNVRGSSGYGKSYLALDNGMKREDSVRDIGALFDWIETDSDLDASRVAVFGGSYGGYMVLASSVHYSDRLRAAVNIVGISSFVTFLENTQSYRRDLRRAEYGDERNPEMRAYFEKISPLNHADKIAIPMLVVQGQNDPRVPVTEAEQIVRALREQGQAVWYMNALNEGHGYRKKENVDIYQQAVVMFLREHLVGDGTAADAR